MKRVQNGQKCHLDPFGTAQSTWAMLNCTEVQLRSLNRCLLSLNKSNLLLT